MKEMTPAELLALQKLTVFPQVASALRSYAKLLAALEHLDKVDSCLCAEEIVAAAKKRGWKGLEGQ